MPYQSHSTPYSIASEQGLTSQPKKQDGGLTKWWDGLLKTQSQCQLGSKTGGLQQGSPAGYISTH